MKEDKAVFRLSRKLPISRPEAWTWLTVSDQTKKWYGPFRKEQEKLFVTMLQEEGQPEMEGRILACEEESVLILKLGTADDAWIIQLDLVDGDDGSVITLTQDKTGTDADPWIEAGWSFYLDCLLAAILHTPLPLFEDYAPDGAPPEGQEPSE